MECHGASLPLDQEGWFDAIAQALQTSGWILIPHYLNADLAAQLHARAVDLHSYYRPAGVGRGDELHENHRVRTDSIFWLEPGNPVDWLWLQVMESLRLALNQRLFLGLFEYESHYACYQPGSFYRRHLDAFRGEGNRVVSVVLYLNRSWDLADGGELVIYPDEAPQGLCFPPEESSLAVFLSEEIPHEVLPSLRTRYSIAGWFRMNATTGGHIDPAS